MPNQRPTAYDLSSPFSQDYYAGSPWGEYVPRMDEGGAMVTGNEPMTVVGDMTGNPYATIGEMNALTGQPTRESLNVTPLEPSVPMQGGMGAPPQMPPTAFATLLETLMPVSKKGRKPPLRPAGASMMGGGY
jgi:hypothetical protein